MFAIKRRNFFKTLGLTSLAGFAGVASAAPDQSKQAIKQVNADVVIIGAGTAGLVAAIRAKDLGANVVLLEKPTVLTGTQFMRWEPWRHGELEIKKKPESKTAETPSTRT